MLVDGEPVVIDFGIAQALDSTRLTQTGMFMGTPGYLAPEVIEGQPSGPASDVHAWGGHGGLRGHRPPAVRHRLVRDDLLPDRERPAGPGRGARRRWPRCWRGALRRDPAARPAAAQLCALAAALDVASLQPVPVPAGCRRPAGPGHPGRRPGALPDPGRVRRRARRHRAARPAGRAAAGMARPGRRGVGGPAGRGGRAGPAGTQPMAVGQLRADDFADVLPPVNYQRGRGPTGTRPRPVTVRRWPRPGGGPRGRAARGQRTAAGRRLGGSRCWSGHHGDRGLRGRRAAVAGTLLALAMLTLLRAGDLARTVARTSAARC